MCLVVIYCICRNNFDLTCISFCLVGSLPTTVPGCLLFLIFLDPQSMHGHLHHFSLTGGEAEKITCYIAMHTMGAFLQTRVEKF